MSNDDWRKELDRKAKEREAEKQAAALEAKQAKEQAEYDKKLSRLQSRFKCHICGRPPSIPGKIRVPDSDKPGYAGYDEVQWDVPGDLSRCTICKKWACNYQHIYQGICQECAAKGYLPGDSKRGIFG